MAGLYSRVRVVADGEQITRAGIYKVPIKRYHHDPDLFPGHSVSSTGLRRIVNLSPKHYWAHCVHNPDHIKFKSSDVLRFGKGVHSYLLENKLSPEEFAVCDFKDWNSNEKKIKKWEIKDAETGKVKKFSGWRDDNGNEYKSYLAYKKLWKMFADWSELTIITKSDIEIFKGMAKELAKDPMIQNGLFDGLVEHTIVWQDPETGIWVKVRPDVIPSDNMLGDFKAQRSSHPREIGRSIGDYDYYMQLALGMEGISRVLKRVITSAFLVAQEKVQPYVATVAPVDADSLWWGQRMNRYGLNLIAECLEKDEWRGYVEGPVSVGIPEWKRKALIARAEYDPIPEISGNYLETIIGEVRKSKGEKRE